MKVILIILGIFVYLLIGGVIGYLIDNDDDFGLACMFFWPLVATFFIIVGIGLGMRILAENLVDWLITAVMEPICEQIEIWLSKKEEEKEDDHDN